jgi:predicted DNA-binding protein
MKTTRLTVDMSQEAHKYLKMASAELGISMREFVLFATFEKMEEMEDELLAKKAEETLKRIEAGKEKVKSFKRIKKQVL